MTENQIKALGFKLEKSYDYDQYHTNRYTNGPLEVEFTYEGKHLVSADVSVEAYAVPVPISDLRALVKVFNKKGI